MAATINDGDLAIAERISCADSAFPRLSHEAALAVIRDLGIGAVDISVFAGYEHNPPEAVMASPQGAAARVRERLERHQLRVADLFAILSEPYDALAVNHPDPAAREDSLWHFEQLLEFAAGIGADAVTLLPGATFEGVDENESRTLAAAELQRRAEIAGEQGIALGFEPHVGSVVPTPKSTLELLEQAPDVGVTLDPSHFIYLGIPEAEIDSLIPRTRHVHLRQATQGIIQAPVHEGSIDIARFVRALDAADYAGFLAIEYQWERAMDFNRVDCIGETASLRDQLLQIA